MATAPLDNETQVSNDFSVINQLQGKHLLITGVTGFVGKVLLTLIASRAPKVRKISVLIRANKSFSHAQERFDVEVMTSEPFKAVRQQVDQQSVAGDFDRWVREVINPITGDITQPQLGISDDDYQEITQTDPLDIILHCAGNVNFDPPLNDALEVNTLGAKHKVALAKAANCPLVHMSTCFVVGERSGVVTEDAEHLIGYTPNGRDFDPNREVADAIDLIERIKRESQDQVISELFYQQARDVLTSKGQAPDSEDLLRVEIDKQRDRWVKDKLRHEGMTRAKRWGWTNTYTYSKSLGEQLTLQEAQRAGVQLSIVRPAIVESAHTFPFPGWNEGINTCAPIVYLYWKGQRFSPSHPNNILDVIPVDWVCQGTLLAAAQQLEGTQAKLIYQLSTGGENPLRMRRAIELTNLAWRAQYDKDFKPLKRHIMRNLDTITVTADQYQRYGAPAIEKTTQQLRGLFKALPKSARRLIKPIEQGVNALNKSAKVTDAIFTLFAPFILENNPQFESKHALQAAARLSTEEADILGYPVHTLDWRHYWIDVHMAGLQKWAFGQLDDRLSRPKVINAEQDLVALLRRVCRDYQHKPALQYFTPEGIAYTYTYGDLWQAALAVAGAMQNHGITEGDRVLLIGANEPAWPMIYFGVLLADATVVPVDHDMSVDEVSRIAQTAKARLIIHHEEWRLESDPSLSEWSCLTWGDCLSAPPIAEAEVTLKSRRSQLASLLFTSGTTGDPKGVMLSHENFCSLVANLHQVFKVSHRDRFLSVLPLFHTFEFSGGLLMPLSVGAQITYVSDREGPTLRKAMKEIRPTGMIGIPALWDVLEKRIKSQVEDRGEVAKILFKASTALNRQARHLGLNLGPTLFSEVHKNLGGQVRYLISGGAALNQQTLDIFEGLGFELLEGYGLTEAAPVLAVRRPGDRKGSGSVGKALPQVEIKIKDPDAEGIGEVLARGPNVMQGYLDQADATAAVLKDGWLYTGDLGYLDQNQQLVLTGRSKELIVTSSGKNVYPDELEPIFADHPFIKEISIVGIPDPQGDERVAALIVLTEEAPEEAHSEIKAHINVINAVRADHQRLRTYRFWPTDLPRTATRKIQRTQVKLELLRLLEVSKETRRVASQHTHQSLHLSPQQKWLYSAISALTDTEVDRMTPTTHIISDLGLSSLQRVELRMMIEDRLGTPLESELFMGADTLDQLQKLLEGKAIINADQNTTTDDNERPLWQRLPSPVKGLGQKTIDLGRGVAFNTLFKIKVKGREHIPFNQQSIVIANHTSHLDLGLIKEALNSYGDELCALAAQDYFFDDEYKDALLSQFTRILPVDRTAPLERSLKAAEDAIAQGYNVLIYPEGTRSGDGELIDFKLGVGYLQRKTKLPILPLYLKGTYRAFPKGENVPKFGRTLTAKIGPLVSTDLFDERCHKKRRHEQYQEATNVCYEAIQSLRDGEVYPWSVTDEKPTDLGPSNAERLLLELNDKFSVQRVNKPITWYFSLGDRADEKWTLSVNEEGVKYYVGKPKVGSADCVLKTDISMFTRMVREGYVPSFTEFAEGKVKTNNPAHLRAFQSVFGL
jgi:long-chain acyl-CoA synthetase